MDSARKLTIDSLDVNNLHKDGKTWELIVRKMRAGMMPPPGMTRPEPAVYESMIAYPRERNRSHGTAVHAGARPSSSEPDRIREHGSRHARSRHRSRPSTCRTTTRRTDSTTSPARSGCRRRWSRPMFPPRRRSAAWRSANRSSRRSSSIAHLRTRRRTTTSKGCPSARAAVSSCRTCFPRTVNTRSR